MSEEIRVNVANILASAGVTMKATLLGETNKDNGDGKPWVCDAWVITFTGACVVGRRAVGGVSERFDYFTGTGHRVDTATTKLARVSLKNVSRNSIAWHEGVIKGMKPKAPDAAGVLSSLLLDSSAASQTFTDWCGDFGYDTDSRKAFAMYEACQQSADKLRKIFNGTELDALREALQDY